MRRLAWGIGVITVLLFLPAAAQAAPWSPGPEAVGPATVEGVIDTPRDGTSFALGEEIPFYGWVVDTGLQESAGIDQIHIYAGYAGPGRLLTGGRVGIKRSDVAAALNRPAFELSGFEARVDSSLLGVGNHLIVVYAHSQRGWWYKTLNIEVTQPPCRTESIRVELNPWNIGYAGTGYFPGTAQNGCPIPIGIEINIMVLDAGTDQPVATARTVHVQNLAPNQSATFSTTVDGLFYFGEYVANWTWNWHSAAPGAVPCWNVGASRCLTADGWLGGAINALLDVPTGRALLQAAAENGIIVEHARTAPGVAGSYSLSNKRITIDSRLDSYSAWERAAVLAHELQHAIDHAAGRLGTGTTCYMNEEDAFLREAEVWAEFWNYRLPIPQHSLQAELNDITHSAARDPYRLIGTYLSGYGHQCE